MNTPNKITLSRLLLIPFVIFFYVSYFIPYGRFIAAIIFTIACLTDFVDGKIARKTGQVTDLGKFFDAIADKVLIMTGMLLIISIPLRGASAAAQPVIFTSICMIIILAREFMVSALRQIAAAKGLVLAADKGGKIKALFQDVTVTLYMFYAGFVADTELFFNAPHAANVVNTCINIFLLVLLSISTFLTIYSGASYIIRNRHVFKSEKSTKVERAELSEFKAVEKEDVKIEQYDALIPQAMNMFLETGWASATMLQKKLGVGYPRASRIVEQMERIGLISSLSGKTRQVLVNKEEFEKKYKQLF